MKQIIILAAVLLFCVMNLYAQRTPKQERILKLAEENLQATLKQGNDMLKASALEAVIDIKRDIIGAPLSKTVIPVMSILRNHHHCSVRCLAAQALYELGDERGLLAIKEAWRFDRNITVQNVCRGLSKEMKSL